jgi:hypothetical protein
MTKGSVLDPTATQDKALAPRPAEAIGDLHGKRIGVRVDIMWRSWDWVTDEWTAALNDAGASLVTWRAGVRNGHEGARMEAELADFVDEVDLAVVGLAN